MVFKKILRLLLISLCCFCSPYIHAQDTLPNFTAIKKKDGSVHINWINDYGIVKQITIQRSTDPKRNFTSITTDSLPMNKKGSFIDKKAKLVNFYYRIYIQLPEGKYLYTVVKKAIKEENYLLLAKPKQRTIKNYADSVLPWLFGKYLKFKRDNPQNEAGATEGDNGSSNQETVWQPSDYVFTDKKGNILVVLPNAENKNFSIRFFDKQGKQVLQIKRIQESNLILERYNFYKSGWYLFEIKEGNTVFEKQKFFLPPLITPTVNGRNK